MAIAKKKSFHKAAPKFYRTIMSRVCKADENFEKFGISKLQPVGVDCIFFGPTPKNKKDANARVKRILDSKKRNLEDFSERRRHLDMVEGWIGSARYISDVALRMEEKDKDLGYDEYFSGPGIEWSCGPRNKYKLEAVYRKDHWIALGFGASYKSKDLRSLLITISIDCLLNFE